VEPVYSADEIERRLQSLDHSGVTLTIVDTAGGDHGRHSLQRFLPDSGASERRRYRSDRRDA
jgi:hypothetical protein